MFSLPRYSGVAGWSVLSFQLMFLGALLGVVSALNILRVNASRLKILPGYPFRLEFGTFQCSKIR